ncbi:MAG: spore coat associated protein CotJA [Oscillospiraceae bacterium]|nr:spore coat associated protein CotJA [Oscillospiraceae bacterium]MBQ2997784.1 spore coat associated protein CotJA [Oscillospiraceae bacterium]MBQ6700974.1 spore coat associated protein CotJA [Oscillospiraceae bacterium]MBQ6802971.1 spore coat associated protein CotJA [Oscillospiraceae bacterium]
MENNGSNITIGCPGTEGVLAMAKVPIQPWGPVYDGSTAFARGTLFPALDLPYIGKEDAK